MQLSHKEVVNINNENDILKYAIENGMINLQDVQKEIAMKKRENLLAQHPYSIWQGKDGKWRTRIPDPIMGKKMIKRTTREAVEDAIIEYIGNQDTVNIITFDMAYHNWRKTKDQLVTDNSTCHYDTDYRRYFENNDFAKTDITKITEEDIQVFMVDTIKRLNLCQKGAKTLFSYIRNTFKSAIINRKKFDIELDCNPTEFLEAKMFYPYCNTKKKSKDQIIVSDDDMKMIWNKLQEDHAKCENYIPSYAVEFAMLTGMRVGEIAGLKWDCVSDRCILIDKSEKYNKKTKEYFIDSTKNCKEREFPMTSEIKQLLTKVKRIEMEYGYISEWVFSNENGRIHTSVISSCCKNKCLQLGIPTRGIHAFRKTLNSKLRCNGVSATVAASLLGHTEDVNEQYYTFDVTGMEEKQKIVSSIHDKTKAVICG